MIDAGRKGISHLALVPQELLVGLMSQAGSTRDT
jgi:hypothetical protein